MTQHTPGPWHVGPGRASHIIYAADGYAVADAKTFHLKHDGGEANARLIAAAPDMLAALAAIEAAADYAKDNPRRQTDKLFDILETARAAIAKARGNTP